MAKRVILAVAIAGLALSGCAQQLVQATGPLTGPTTGASSGASDARVWSNFPGPPQLTGKALDKALAEAEKHPLGSAKNPVRVNRPTGERDYLARLRCSDGRRPDFVRRGNVGIGVFGNIIDLYDVNCHSAAPGQVEIYMDMYFNGAGEQRAVPGFTIK